MWTVNSFCCFRLHTAGVLLGWIGAALSLLNVITYTIVWTQIDGLIKIIKERNTDLDDASAKTVAMTVLAIYITINIIDCIASILLIAGTIKERHLLIVPWLINSGISLTFNFINVIAVIAMLISSGSEVLVVVFVIALASVILGIQFMAWLAMYSLFKLIRQSSETQRLIPSKSGPAFPSYTRI